MFDLDKLKHEWKTIAWGIVSLALECELYADPTVLDAFIDDLPEILKMPGLPERCRRILFAPDGSQTETPFEVCCSWPEITALLFGRTR